MDITVDLVGKRNYKELARIYAQEFSKKPFNENWTEQKALKKIEMCSKYCDIFEIKSNDEIIGFIIVNTNFWDFEECVCGEDIAIKSEFQNKGVGKIVFNKIFEYYKKKGFKKFYGVIIAERLKFYEHLGLKLSKHSLFAEKEL